MPRQLKNKVKRESGTRSGESGSESTFGRKIKIKVNMKVRVREENTAKEKVKEEKRNRK